MKIINRLTTLFSHLSLMGTKTTGLADLPMSQAFSYIASQDPNVSLRFYIPVPNWLDDKGQPVHQDESVIWSDKHKEYRYVFRNEVDRRQQAVRVDGSGVIVLNGLSPKEADLMLMYVRELGPRPLTPQDCDFLLETARTAFGCVDCYNGSAKDVPARMHPFLPEFAKSDTVLGAWLPKPQESSAVYIPGASKIALLTGQPQLYLQGAYVTFPSIKPHELQGMDTQALKGLLRSRKVTPRAVEAGVFEAQNTTPDGGVIKNGLYAIPSDTPAAARRPA